MFFLPNESYKHRNKHFVITFGKPILYDTFHRRLSPKEWAQLVRDHTYLIPDEPLKNFNYLHSENSRP